MPESRAEEGIGERVEGWWYEVGGREPTVLGGAAAWWRLVLEDWVVGGRVSGGLGGPLRFMNVRAEERWGKGGVALAKVRNLLHGAGWAARGSNVCGWAVGFGGSVFCLRGDSCGMGLEMEALLIEDLRCFLVAFSSLLSLLCVELSDKCLMLSFRELRPEG